MRKFIESAQRTVRRLPVLSWSAVAPLFGSAVAPLFLLTASLICGCAAQPADVVADTPKLEAPVVQPEPSAPGEATSLQRYQEVNQLYQAEKSRNAGLETDLAQQRAGRQKAEAENEDLHKQLKVLSAKAEECDATKAKLDEAQKASLAMESTLRDLRHELLVERLAGVKRDETIVALKIEKAKDARKTGALPLSGFDRAPDSERGATALPERGATALPEEAATAVPEKAVIAVPEKSATALPSPPKNPPAGGLEEGRNSVPNAVPAVQQTATGKGIGVANP